MRLFVGFWITADAKKSLQAFRESHPHPEVHFSTENPHCTLLFLGEISETQLPEIIRSLSQVHHPPISASLSSIDFFLFKKQIHVIYAGLEPKEELRKLQAAIASALKKYKKQEKRPYIPHITLARPKSLRNPDGVLKWKNEELSGMFTIDSFYLLKSELCSKGSKYTEMKRFKLTEI